MRDPRAGLPPSAPPSNPPRPLLAKPRFGEDTFGQRHWAAPDLKPLPDPDLVAPGEWSRDGFDGRNFGRNIPYALAHAKRRAALELASLPPEVRAAKLAGEAALAREAERDGVLAETHLASQARLQGQIALRELRQRASEGSSGSILPELLGAHDRLSKEQTKSLPLELRRRVETKLGEVRSWLEGQGAIAEQALGEDRRRRMVEQRLELGEALLAQEPESYEIATSEFESLADGLSLKGQRRRAFLSAAQARAAEAALKGHLELNPRDGLEDLTHGRFGAALTAEQAEPWRKLLANAQRFRQGVAEAETRLAQAQERQALATTLEQASRNEAPLPSLELIERHHPGRGPEILAAIEGEAQRQAMIGELLQRGPEEEESWLAEAPEATERQHRQEAVDLKRQRLQAEPERFLALYDGQLAQALAQATQDPASHLKQAIQLYGQAWARHRIGQKPSATLDPDQAVIAEPHRILPRETLTALAEQFRNQGDAPKRLSWMTALDKSLGPKSFDKLIANWRQIPDAIPPGLEQLIGKARDGAPPSMLALQLDALETQEREGFLRLVSDDGGRDGDASAATGGATTVDDSMGAAQLAQTLGEGEAPPADAGSASGDSPADEPAPMAAPSGDVEAVPLTPPDAPASGARGHGGDQLHDFDIFESEEERQRVSDAVREEILAAAGSGEVHWLSNLTKKLGQEDRLDSAVAAILGRPREDLTAAEVEFLSSAFASPEGAQMTQGFNQSVEAALIDGLKALPAEVTAPFGASWSSLSEAERFTVMRELVEHLTASLGFEGVSAVRDKTVTGIAATDLNLIVDDSGRPTSDAFQPQDIAIGEAPVDAGDALQAVLHETVHLMQQKLVRDYYAGKLAADQLAEGAAIWLAMSMAYYRSTAPGDRAYSHQSLESDAFSAAETAVNWFLRQIP